jgi:hypothetical protein
MTTEDARIDFRFESLFGEFFDPIPGFLVDGAEHLATGAGSTTNDADDISDETTNVHGRKTRTVLGSKIVSHSCGNDGDTQTHIDQIWSAMVDASAILIGRMGKEFN